MAGPVLRDVDAAGPPDVIMALCVIQEALDGHHPPWAAGKPAMQPDGQHLGPPGSPFCIEHVETVLEILVEMLARVKALRGCEPHIIGIQRVGHDQLRVSAVAPPVGQIIGVAVGAIGKPALLGHQSNGVFRAAPSIPTRRTAAGDFFMQTDRLHHVVALFLGVEIFVVDPFQAVARNFPIRFLHGGHLFGAAGQGCRHPINRQRNLHVGEQPVQPPETRPGPVLIDRFHVPVPLVGPSLRTDDLRQKCFGRVIPMQDAILAPFLIVQHHLNCDFGASGPVCYWRDAPIPVHVS